MTLRLALPACWHATLPANITGNAGNRQRRRQINLPRARRWKRRFHARLYQRRVPFV